MYRKDTIFNGIVFVVVVVVVVVVCWVWLGGWIVKVIEGVLVFSLLAGRYSAHYIHTVSEDLVIS